MSNIKNLDRDMTWPVSLVTTTPTLAAFASPVGVAAPATVNQRVSSAFSSFFSSTAGGSFRNMGALILPPVDGDVTPYRVIGSYGGPNTVIWSYGWFNAAAAAAPVTFACGDSVDLVVAIAPLDSADPNYGRPLCVFASVFDNVTFTANSLAISVQRMISKPPQYASAVS